MSWQDSQEAQVMFHDASAYFSEEEWKLLHEWQKELYRNVMKEIHKALISLGPLITTTVFSLRAKEKEDMGPMDNQYSGRRHKMNTSPSDTVANPDVLFRINREEHLNLNNPQVSEGHERHDCLGSEFPFLDADICLRKEEEPASIFIDHLGAEIRESSMGPNSEHDVVSFRIKDEDEPYCMDRVDSKRIESISRPKGDGSMNRKQNIADPLKRTRKTPPSNASSGSAKVEMAHSYEEGTHSRSQPRPESNQELGKKTTQCKLGFSDPARFSFQQGTPKVHTSETYDWGGNLCDANLSVCQPNIQKNISLYSCTECEKTFSKKESLNWHKRTHMRMRPYQCTECEKSFRKKDNLCKHQRTHTGERPYHCNLCEKSFSQKGVLKRHQRTHMEDLFYCTPENT